MTLWHRTYPELRRTYEQIEIGETASRTRTMTEEDIFAFARLIGNSNPVHLDAEYAKTTMFGERIAHGMHTGFLLYHPDRNETARIEGIYVSQEIKFIRPVRIGDTITAQATVIEKDDAKRRITLKTTVANQRGELIHRWKRGRRRRQIGSAAKTARDKPPQNCRLPKSLTG